MPTPGIRLGVDFGTSNTVAVVRWPDGRSRPLIFDGSPLLPSAVYVEPGGTIIVGRDAVHSARLEPARFEPNPKRRIDDGTVLLGDREVPVNDLIAAVLRRVRDEFAHTVGADAVPEVTVTVPASWGATRRLAVADAAASAGLGKVRLVPEPVAAAAYFTQVLGHEVKVGSVVVVHDFGAGTFDASVVARTADGFEALAVDGRDDIGGIDVDAAIVNHIGTICEPRAPQEWARLVSPQTVEDRRHRRLLWDDARVAKERLSRQPASDLTIPLLNFDVHLTRDELETLARPMIEQTVRVTQGVMRWAQLSEGAVAGVFLVGGSSRIPLVATLLHRMLGTAPTAIEQPELVVAEGSMLTGSTSTQATAQPAPGPATGVMPEVPGFPWEQSSLPPVSSPPVSSSPDSWSQVSSSQVSSSQVSSSQVSGQPFSGPPVGGSQVSGAPVSGPLDSAPSGFTMPPPSRFGAPDSGPPVNRPMWPETPPPLPPVSVPPSASPVSSPPPYPVSGPPVSGQQSAHPVSTPPVSGPPSGYPVSAPPVSGHAAASARPVSTPPVSGPPSAYQVSTPPVSGRPVSSAPPPARPISAPPVSSPPNRPTSSGRVYGSAPNAGVPEPATRYDEYGRPFKSDQPQQRVAPSPAPVPQGPPPRQANQVAEYAKVYNGTRHRSRAARTMRVLFVVVLIVAVPLIAGVISYYLTTDHLPPLLQDWFGSNPS
ncbi:Hsp70 family protein [Dactylosporangium sp. CS-033363]|uniref:Hsp70 family protein n=1 Tax=Dactylosporangium sp. CS-033363 TaxID=3239935 RepID=UPI003D927AAC